MTPHDGSVPVTPCVAVYAQRERVRSFARSVFTRRRARVVMVKSGEELASVMRESLVDAVLVDVGAAAEETWRVAALAREFPSAPFFGVSALRLGEASILGHCVQHEFADVLLDGVDDAVARAIVLHRCFSSRFARALDEPPVALALGSDLQRAVWRFVVAHGGRPVRTAALAEELRVTREHLSRSFAARGAPNLKRVIDLVRLLAAAELAKNPGHDLRDVSHVLGYASPSHLSGTAQRIAGTKSASLSRLRSVDLVERFVRGHGRSRG